MTGMVRAGDAEQLDLELAHKVEWTGEHETPDFKPICDLYCSIKGRTLLQVATPAEFAIHVQFIHEYATLCGVRPDFKPICDLYCSRKRKAAELGEAQAPAPTE
jgi:hypothetical protein